ncbi:uncharacterized protein LOC120015579 [Tripterygium wilfordii]|uniref:uncharacterized protein LOC120015579 n=1 Tax=Tripterygium wilfordii TaxID=458696 RepID=UPI0018F85DE6|nr:uncharacterized protein LOC120015579 [Tripterygium wilfordii]
MVATLMLIVIMHSLHKSFFTAHSFYLVDEACLYIQNPRYIACNNISPYTYQGLTLACKKVTMKALLVFLLIFVLVLETMAANGKLFTGTVVEEEKKVTGTTNRRLLGEPTDLGRKVGGGKGTDVKNDDDDNKNDSFGNYDQGTGLYTETHHRFTTTTNPIEPSNHN